MVRPRVVNSGPNVVRISGSLSLLSSDLWREERILRRIFRVVACQVITSQADNAEITTTVVARNF